MNWRDAVEEVAKYAPAVATALGGPAVGGITAGAAEMITSAMGVRNTPQALVAGLEDPVKREALVRLNNEHERELLALRLKAEQAQAEETTKQMQAVNATAQAELAAEPGFRTNWRPFNGWMLGISLSAVNVGMIVLAFMRPDQLDTIIDVLIWSVAAQGAVQGINIKQRSNDKRLRMGKAPASFMDEIGLGGDKR